MFAHGKLMTHMVFNDAVDTLRRRMETRHDEHTSAFCVEYLPVPPASPSGRRNGHVEGWNPRVRGLPVYYEAANDVLEWFLQRPIQQAYAWWGRCIRGFRGHRRAGWKRERWRRRPIVQDLGRGQS